ncbi:hypothetical protein U1Q18_032556 [Sarracenia purpurea var. burkii]
MRTISVKVAGLLGAKLFTARRVVGSSTSVSGGATMEEGGARKLLRRRGSWRKSEFDQRLCLSSPWLGICIPSMSPHLDMKVSSVRALLLASLRRSGFEHILISSSSVHDDPNLHKVCHFWPFLEWPRHGAAKASRFSPHPSVPRTLGIS